MSLQENTKQEISRFADEQSLNYLEQAEMSYQERLKQKLEQTKKKASGKLSRFKNHSDKALEAKNDLTLFMTDYINDLISQGLSEAEALEKAKAELAVSSESEQQNAFAEKMQQYYENWDPVAAEVTGLLYGGFCLLGIVLGALIGFLTSGGRLGFLAGGWIDTLIGTGVGVLLGTCLGLICQAIITAVKRK